MDDIKDSQIIRSKVEEALRFFVKLPIVNRANHIGPEDSADSDAFLEIPGPKGESIEFFERDARVELRFGFGGESFDFSGVWGDDDGVGAELDPEASAAEAEEDFKDELEALVNATMDIIEETLFSAQYEVLSVQMGGLFPAEDFEEMRANPGFESVSWNGKYSIGPVKA
ncbi:MAG: hypothetical protein JWP91_1485 [Fibrobacteres bacterium]|nr:hypothetical protein [Fibrobacterota bacterium]